MLVLTRKLKESIMIGDNIELTVVDIRGDIVRLGIEAPEDAVIKKLELIDQRKSEEYGRIAGVYRDSYNRRMRYYMDDFYDKLSNPVKYRNFVSGGICLP